MDEERLPASAVDELGDRVMRVRGHRPQGLAARLCRIPYAGELIDYINFTLLRIQVSRRDPEGPRGPRIRRDMLRGVRDVLLFHPASRWRHLDRDRALLRFPEAAGDDRPG